MILPCLVRPMGEVLCFRLVMQVRLDEIGSGSHLPWLKTLWGLFPVGDDLCFIGKLVPLY